MHDSGKEATLETYEEFIGMFVVAERRNQKKAVGILKEITPDNILYIQGRYMFCLVDPEEMTSLTSSRKTHEVPAESPGYGNPLTRALHLTLLRAVKTRLFLFGGNRFHFTYLKSLLEIQTLLVLFSTEIFNLGNRIVSSIRHPILRTRLLLPPVATDILPRDWLTNRLNEEMERALTLISAPAGYGKSTLASRWVEASETKSAWVSLNKTDNDPGTFLNCLLTAIRSPWLDY